MHRIARQKVLADTTQLGKLFHVFTVLQYFRKSYLKRFSVLSVCSSYICVRFSQRWWCGCVAQLVERRSLTG